jgi:hypothetical protein
VNGDVVQEVKLELNATADCVCGEMEAVLVKTAVVVERKGEVVSSEL